jgi:hypothetical protein
MVIVHWFVVADPVNNAPKALVLVDQECLINRWGSFCQPRYNNFMCC